MLLMMRLTDSIRVSSATRPTEKLNSYSVTKAVISETGMAIVGTSVVC